MSKIPNYDVFGYCVKCGKYMVTHEVIDGVHQQRFTPDYTNVAYLLNDGSQMRVAMCRKCESELNHSDEETEYIMDKVWRGWQHEVETYSKWNDDKKKDYLERYKKKVIVIRSDDKPKDVIAKEFKKFKEKKDKKKVEV